MRKRCTSTRTAGSSRRLSTRTAIGQTKEHWKQFEQYLEDPAANPPPDGYTAPFYKADRVAEYRQAHAVFSERLRKARAEGDMR